MTGGNCKYLIAVVEDSPADVFLIREALKEYKLPYELLDFSNGDQVLTFLRALETDRSMPCPDLFLVDLHMPGRSSLEVIGGIRENHRCPRAPVLVITSSDSPADRAGATAAGATAFFRKPLDLEQFLTIGRLVRDLLEKPACASATP